MYIFNMENIVGQYTESLDKALEAISLKYHFRYAHHFDHHLGNDVMYTTQ